MGKINYKWQFSIAFCMFTWGYPFGKWAILIRSQQGTRVLIHTKNTSNDCHGTGRSKWLVDDWFGATLTFKKNKMGIIISHELWIQFRSPSSILWKPRYSGIKTMVSCNVSLKSIHWSCYIPLYRQFFWFSHYFAGAITFFFDIPSSV